MNWDKPKSYAVKHKDIATRMSSRSGGVFTALSDLILKNNGVIYGCVLTDCFEAIHIRAINEVDRNRMRGSKYVQSCMGDVFKEVKRDLQDGKEVLFSGTPCQIAGLKSFLGVKYPNLFCVDIVCHGVPSPSVWKKYLEWQESKHGKCVSVDYRNKIDYGWADHVESLWFKKNDYIKRVDSRIFTTIFYGHHILRPSCYHCPYKSTLRHGDISIADYWGIEKAAPGFDDNKGVSLVLINNDKGSKMFEMVKEEVLWQKTNIEDSLRPSLIAPFDEPKDRLQFWESYQANSFEYIAKKYGQYGMKNEIKKIVYRVKRKVSIFIHRVF